MNLLWRLLGLGKKQQSAVRSAAPRHATFEQLEPRLLLDGEGLIGAGFTSDFDNQDEAAISVDIDPGSTLLADNVSVELEIETAAQPKAPDLPGLQLVDPDISSWQGQIIYLDFDGEENVTYNGPVTVGPFDVPAFSAPGELAGQEDIIISEVLVELEQTFAGTGVVFTAEKPSDGIEYSTVYVGGDDSIFAEYGDFFGLAEQVDVGNLDRSDEGLVFADGVLSYQEGVIDSVTTLSRTIAHEVGHLLGYLHTSIFKSPLILDSVCNSNNHLSELAATYSPRYQDTLEYHEESTYIDLGVGKTWTKQGIVVTSESSGTIGQIMYADTVGAGVKAIRAWDAILGKFSVGISGDYSITFNGYTEGKIYILSSSLIGNAKGGGDVNLIGRINDSEAKKELYSTERSVGDVVDDIQKNYDLLETILLKQELPFDEIRDEILSALEDANTPTHSWPEEGTTAPFSLSTTVYLEANTSYTWRFVLVSNVDSVALGNALNVTAIDILARLESVAIIPQFDLADAVTVEMIPSSTSVSPGDSIEVSGTALLDYEDEGYYAPITDGVATIKFSGSQWTVPVTDGTYSLSIPVAANATSGPLVVTALDYNTGLSGSDSVSITVNTSSSPLRVAGSSTPGQIDLSLAPGQGRWFDIPVQNMSLSPITVHFSVSGSADDWASPQSDSFTLDAQQTVYHRLYISVPDDLGTGKYTLNATYEGITLPFSIQVTSTSEPWTEHLTTGDTYVDGDWSVVTGRFNHVGQDYFDISGKYQMHAQTYLTLSEDQVINTAYAVVVVTVQNINAYNEQDLDVYINDNLIGSISEDDVEHGDSHTATFTNIPFDYLIDGVNVLTFKLSRYYADDETIRWRANDGASFSRRQTDDAFADEVTIPSNVMNAIDDGYMDYARLYAHVDNVSSDGKVYLFNNGEYIGQKTIDGGDQGRDIYWSLSKSDLDDDNYFVLQGDDDTKPRVRLSNIYLKIALNNNDPVLEIIKQLSQTTVTVGDQFTVTINVRNMREGSATGNDTDLDDADLPVGLTLVSGQLDKNNIGSLEYEESKSNAYTVRADQAGRYVLGAARVLYENIDGDDFVDTSSPVYLEVTAGPLTVEATTVLAESGGSARVNFDAQVSYDGSPIGNANVRGVVEKNLGGTWVEIDSLLLGWSTAAESYVGVSGMLPGRGAYRAYTVAEKDLYETGTSTPQEFVYTTNTSPDQPVGLAPWGTDVSLEPTLESSTFSDDAGDTHAASRWQIATDSGFANIIWDQTDTDADSTHETVPAGILSYDTTYYFRVSHQDRAGAQC